jgi:hypothetical protein
MRDGGRIISYAAPPRTVCEAGMPDDEGEGEKEAAQGIIQALLTTDLECIAHYDTAGKHRKSGSSLYVQMVSCYFETCPHSNDSLYLCMLQRSTLQRRLAVAQRSMMAMIICCA